MLRRVARLWGLITLVSLLLWAGAYGWLRLTGRDLQVKGQGAIITRAGQPWAVMPGLGTVLSGLRQPPALITLVLLPSYLAIKHESRRLRRDWRHKPYQVLDYRHATKEEIPQETGYLRFHRQPEPQSRQPAYGLEG